MTPTHGRQKRHEAAHERNGQAEPATGCLRLYRKAMVEAGAASQTFSALLTFCNGGDQVFASLDKIADAACLQKRTVQRHIDTLLSLGWIKHYGYQPVSGTKRLRKTITYLVTDKGHKANDGGFDVIRREHAARLPYWSMRAVFAAAVSRKSLVEHIQEQGCSDDREYIKTSEIRNQTGLDRTSIYRAVDALEQGNWIIVSRPGVDAVDNEIGIKINDDD